MERSGKQAIGRARSVGPEMILWMDAAGYNRPVGFAGETPENAAFRMEVCTGRRLTRPIYAVVAKAPWQCLYFLPEPQGHASLRPTLPHVDGSFGSRSVAAT